MLKTLSIRNFQSHRDTQVGFDPDLTVLVGQSNSGKTAILRALGWILRNRPRGTAFINDDADSAEVRLTTDRGEVSRRKGRKGGDGEYAASGEVLTALGGDVPQQVKDLLGMADVNVADQLSPHFLLLDSPGQIARTVNEAVRLERAEAAVKAAESNARSTKAEAKRTKESLDAAESSFKALSWVEGISPRLDRVRSAWAILGASLASLESLRRAIRELEAVGRVRMVIPEDAQDRAAALAAGWAALDETRRRIDSLDRLADELGSVEKRLSRFGDLEGMAARASELATALAAVDDTLSERQDLDEIVGCLNIVAEDVTTASAGLLAGEEVERKLLSELTVCPTCGQGLDEDAKRRIIDDRG